MAVTMSGAPSDGPQGEEREGTLQHRPAQRETGLCAAASICVLLPVRYADTSSRALVTAYCDRATNQRL